MRLMQIEPQPARGKLDPEMWLNPNWIAEEKYDGIRLVGQMDTTVRFTTRRVSSKTGLLQERTDALPHLAGTGKGAPWPRSMYYTLPAALDGTVLDGEILPAPELLAKLQREGGGVSKAVQSMLNSLPAEAIRKQIERGWLHWVVFDCLYWKGEDVRHLMLDERVMYAGCAIRTWGNPFATLAERAQGDKQKFYRSIVKRGGEGVILKHLTHRYGDEKLWVKVKKLATADVVIIGFKMAKATSKKVDGTVSATKYAGKVGSVEIGQYKGNRLMPVGFARGFSDHWMDNFSRRPKDYIGKTVITIEANDREPTGKFRHPRVTDSDDFIRTDKRPQDCIFDLEEK